MECPRCGFEQPPSDECVSCGIVFAKYHATSDTDSGLWSRELPSDSGPAAWKDANRPSTGETRDRSGARLQALTTRRPRPPQRKLERGIGKPVAFVRVLLSIMCIGLVVFMLITGRGLNSWIEYSIMAAYGAAALWGLASAFGKVTVRQFLIEAVGLGVMTGTLVLIQNLVPPTTNPSELNDTVPSNVVETTRYELPKTALGTFTREAMAYTRGAEKLLQLEGQADYAFWDEVEQSVSIDSLREFQSELVHKDRTRTSRAWEAVDAFARSLSSALSRFKRPAGNGYSFTPDKKTRTELQRTFTTLKRTVESLEQLVQVRVDPNANADSSITSEEEEEEEEEAEEEEEEEDEADERLEKALAE